MSTSSNRGPESGEYIRSMPDIRSQEKPEFTLNRIPDLIHNRRHSYHTFELMKSTPENARGLLGNKLCRLKRKSSDLQKGRLLNRRSSLISECESRNISGKCRIQGNENNNSGVNMPNFSYLHPENSFLWRRSSVMSVCSRVTSFSNAIVGTTFQKQSSLTSHGQGSKSEAKTQRLGRLRLEYFQSAKAREAKAGENFVGQG
ncbi:unnamed protein product [Oikopleura dioica]|uniref:Uncharacterized protein n=1 Tax=Oikopleura dioica TaxID=34765 RepID=E4YWU8_OIKDI|nr:unnamed protein product [Oikopleura dioica]